MKIILKVLTILPLLLGFKFCFANDATFRVRGNQLIPMYETDISVKKEILSIRRINKKQAEVNVYYEFYNPNGDKELEVGFEALSPYNADNKPVDGRQVQFKPFWKITRFFM